MALLKLFGFDVRATRFVAVSVSSIALLGALLPPAGAQQLPTGAGMGASMGATGSISAGGAAGMGAVSVGGVPSIRTADPLAPGQQAPSTPQAQGFEPLKPNAFQQFVLETSGFQLPLYGQSFFDNVQQSQRQYQQLHQPAQNSAQTSPPSTNPFAPIDTSPVSADYPLGAGDQLVIRGWGSLDIDARVVIDRNGLISIPRVGTVPLAGVKAGQAEGVLRNAIAKYYKDFQLSVTLGQLRTITVYVVGQARRPGSYMLSNVSTLASGLFASGGPNAIGSMRRVQLKRAGQVVTEFDLYGFLSEGSNAKDAKLIDGDVIFIPPAAGHVALVGKVNTPAVYELKTEGETLEQLFAVAGGLPVTADPRRASLERLTPSQSQPRSVQDFALNAQGLKTALKNGDMLTVLEITPELGNTVTLRGNVSQPVRLGWREGMRVSDLIPNREVLISKDSVRRQNEVLFDNNQRERTQRNRESIPEDLLFDPVLDLQVERQLRERAFGNGANQANQATSSALREARQKRLFDQQPMITPVDKKGPPSVAESVGNLYDEINWEYAVIERINRKDLSVSLVPFNLARVIDNPKDPDNQALQPGDVVTVFSATDVRVPISKRRVIVRIEGEVMQPGIYQAKPGETLASVLQRAGGLSHDAYLFGSAFYREEVRKSQQENLEKLVRRLEAETSANLAQIGQSTGASTDVNLAQARFIAAQQAQRQAMERVRSIKPEGRIALGLQPDTNNFINKIPDLRVQNGDRFVVASRPDFVYVFGSVNTESALIYRPGQSVDEYLKQSGVSSGGDRDSVILIRADGTALTAGDSWLFGSIRSTKVMPGDTIVLPEKLDREATWSVVMRNTKDITQIFYQLGLGAAALKTLRN